MYLDIANRSTASGSVVARSNKPEVRNPILAYPSAAKASSMPPEAREWLILFLEDLRRDARERAAKAWKAHKAAIALYAKVVQVYTGHLIRVLRRAGEGA
jgi:uncharacterized membrane protein